MEHEIEIFYAGFYDKQYIKETLQEHYNNGFYIMKTFFKRDTHNIMFIMAKHDTPAWEKYLTNTVHIDLGEYNNTINPMEVNDGK